MSDPIDVIDFERDAARRCASITARRALSLLDQRLLPEREVWVDCRTVDEVARAIQDMVVRGAPAIGCAAAYGMAHRGAHAACRSTRRPRRCARRARRR